MPVVTDSGILHSEFEIRNSLFRGPTARTLCALPLPRPVRRHRRPRVLRPWMPRILSPQLLPHLLIRAVPEAAEVARDLHRPPRRREQLERDGGAVDARRVGEAEELLQLDGGDDRAVVAVVELRAAAGRKVERCRAGDGLALPLRRRDAADGLLVQDDRAVHRALDDLAAALHRLAVRRREPLALDRARGANQVAGNVEDDEELAAAVVG